MALAPIQLLRAAGLVTALLSAVPSAIRALREPRVESFVFAIPLVVFVSAFLYSLDDAGPKSRRRAALLVESVAGVAFAAVARGGFSGALLAVVAGQAPFLVGAGPALAIVAVQTLSLGAIHGANAGVAGALTVAGGYLGFQLFAAGPPSSPSAKRARGQSSRSRTPSSSRRARSSRRRPATRSGCGSRAISTTRWGMA